MRRRVHVSSQGKGTRLAPLPGAENNNKPGVKLPACVALKSGGARPITILEAVIKQTGAYARAGGRTGATENNPAVPLEYTECTVGVPGVSQPRTCGPEQPRTAVRQVGYNAK
jgi:hypothetical protein